MLQLEVFKSQDEVNNFFKLHEDHLYIVKFIVHDNPFTRTTEWHMVWSFDPRLKGGMHLRMGVAQANNKEVG
jgi:hypothetical protein